MPEGETELCDIRHCDEQAELEFWCGTDDSAFVEHLAFCHRHADRLGLINTQQ